MIDRALACLAQQLDAYLQSAGAMPGRVALARFVDDNGKWTIADNSVGIMLLNVQGEQSHKLGPKSAPAEGAEHSGAVPPLDLKLSVMLAAQSRDYGAALMHLSHVLAFFNLNPVFARAQHAALGSGIERVEVALEALDYEQLGRIWAFVGGRHVPSVVYRVRLVAG